MMNDELRFSAHSSFIVFMLEYDEDALARAREEMNDGSPSEPHEFLFACHVSEIPCDGHGKMVRFEDTEVALFNIGEQIFAISNICPHEMSPLLAAGKIDCAARTVSCPLHGWTFEIPTGKRTDGPGTVPAYDVRIDAGEAWIRLRE